MGLRGKRGEIEWLYGERMFRIVYDENCAELQTPEGDAITLELDEWLCCLTVFSKFSAETSEALPRHGAYSESSWLPREEDDLVGRWESGTPIPEIAEDLGRTPDEVARRLSSLGYLPPRIVAPVSNQQHVRATTKPGAIQLDRNRRKPRERPGSHY